MKFSCSFLLKKAVRQVWRGRHRDSNVPPWGTGGERLAESFCLLSFIQPHTSVLQKVHGGMKKWWLSTRIEVTHRGDQGLPEHCFGCLCGSIWGHFNTLIFSGYAHSFKILFLLPICEQSIQEWVAQRRWFTFAGVLHFLAAAWVGAPGNHAFQSRSEKFCTLSRTVSQDLHSYNQTPKAAVVTVWLGQMWI